MITLDNYKVAEPIDENQKLLDKLNNNFQKGIISEDLYEKSVQQLDSLIEKAKVTKYFKREGSPGNYKYYYTEAEYKEAKGESKENDAGKTTLKIKQDKINSENESLFIKDLKQYSDSKLEELKTALEKLSSKDSEKTLPLVNKEINSRKQGKQSSEKPKGEWQHGSEKKYGQAGYKPKSAMELEDAVRHKYRHSPLSVQKEKVKDEMKRFFPQ